MHRYRNHNSACVNTTLCPHPPTRRCDHLTGGAPRLLTVASCANALGLVGPAFSFQRFCFSASCAARPPPSVLSVPYCQKSFRVFRVFRGPTLSPPPAARSRAQLYATGDPRSPRHGLESPCHVARAFQPVGLGRAVRSAFRHPSSAQSRGAASTQPPSFFRRLPAVVTTFHAREPSGTKTHRVP